MAKKDENMHLRSFSKDGELIPSELGIRMKLKKRTRESIRRENTPKWKRKLHDRAEIEQKSENESY